MAQAHKTNLQMLRKRAGYRSAREFAEAHGMNVGSYTNYEQGKVALSLLKAWELADILGCTLDELAGRRPPDSALSSGERAVIDAYRSSNAQGRAAIEAVAVSQVGWRGSLRVLEGALARPRT